MRLVVTGGGTGGHVYPALEVARYAREHGDEIVYLGSLRGQEGAASQREGFEFHGFRAEPLYSLKTPRGWKSGLILLRAVGIAKKLLRQAKPDVVFSTGGFSAAPVISGARSLKIPYVLFEANSIPGRTHRMFAPQASAFASVFHKTAERMSSIAVTRTGMPIRKALRDAASAVAGASRPRARVDEHDSLERAAPATGVVLVVGGSQGSAFLNESVPKAAALLEGVPFLHATGTKNFDASFRDDLPTAYKMVPYLEQEAMLQGLSSAKLAVARSGGTLAEFACFRLPSVLVPLPTSADDHQLHNAREFEAMGAATLVEQKNATPERLAGAIRGWLERDTSSAEQAMAEWDVPDATERIYGLIRAARRL